MTPGDIIKTVVLTGPSRGLGRDTALALAARGHRLVLLGRPSDGFDAVCTDARAAGAAGVVTVSTDPGREAELFDCCVRLANGVVAPTANR